MVEEAQPEQRDDRVLKPEDFSDLFEHPAECREVDYKAAVKFDEKTDFAAKLVKHILAFANSGGGHLVIGFRELPNGSFARDPRLSEKVVASYEVTRLSNHLDKYIQHQDRPTIKVYKEEFEGTEYPVICVHRFHVCPLFCTRNYPYRAGGRRILERDQVYMRVEGAKTVRVGTVHGATEWRQLVIEIGLAARR